MAYDNIGLLGNAYISGNRALGSLIPSGASAIGMEGLASLLNRRLDKKADKRSRWLDSSGVNDPFLLDYLKDMSRPARQGAVGLGMLGSRLGGGKGSGSDYLEEGVQGFGDWSSLLDDEERVAPQNQPGKEIGKSALNILR